MTAHRTDNSRGIRHEVSREVNHEISFLLTFKWSDERIADRLGITVENVAARRRRGQIHEFTPAYDKVSCAVCELPKGNRRHRPGATR